MIGRILDWWRRLRVTSPQIVSVQVFASISEIDDPPRRSVAVVGSLEHPKWLVFACPCGTGHTIQLPTSPKAFPRWTLAVDNDGRPTISPSIDDLREKRCHFWLRNGSVHWVHDDD